MQSKLWSIIIITLILGIVFSKKSNAQEDLYEFGEFVRLLGGKAIKIDKEDAKNAVEIEYEGGSPAGLDDIGERVKIKSNRRLLCQPGYNFALKAKGDEVWLNYNTKVQVMKGSTIKIEKGEICADELNETVFQLQIGQTTVFIEPKKCRRFYLKYYEEDKEALVSRSSGEITMSYQGAEDEVMDESSQVAEIKKVSGSPKFIPTPELSAELSKELSKAKKWQEALGRLETQSPITTPFWRKPKFYIPTAAVAAGITAAVLYLTREQEAEVRIHIGMP